MSHLHAELLAVVQAFRFGLRHPRYWLVALMLYGASLPRWRRFRAARLGYAFLQLYDDLMDGDRTCEGPLDVLAERVRREWDEGGFRGGDPLSRLGAATHAALRTAPRLPGDAPEQDIAALLRLMHRDLERRRARLVLPASELEAHLRSTFEHSTNVLFFACGHRLRAAQMPALVAALAWCSVVRDFSADARQGLYNVPREVLGTAPPPLDGPVVLPAVQAWLAAQRARGAGLLAACEEEHARLAGLDPAGARLARMFARSMRKYG